MTTLTLSTIGTITFFAVGLAAHFLSGMFDRLEGLERLVPWCISGSIFCLVLRVMGC